MYAAKKCLEEMNRFLQHPSYHGALPLVRPLRSHRVLLFVLFLVDHTGHLRRPTATRNGLVRYFNSKIQTQQILITYIFLVYFIYQTAGKIYIIYVVYNMFFFTFFSSNKFILNLVQISAIL